LFDGVLRLFGRSEQTALDDPIEALISQLDLSTFVALGAFIGRESSVAVIDGSCEGISIALSSSYLFDQVELSVRYHQEKRQSFLKRSLNRCHSTRRHEID
jgi:hypothetical protein